MTAIVTLIVIGSTTAITSSGSAEPFEKWDKPAKAPIGSLQPRAKDFLKDTPANRAEQRRLSKFDAIQKRKNRKIDQYLDICRC